MKLLLIIIFGFILLGEAYSSSICEEGFFYPEAPSSKTLMQTIRKSLLKGFLHSTFGQFVKEDPKKLYDSPHSTHSDILSSEQIKALKEVERALIRSGFSREEALSKITDLIDTIRSNIPELVFSHNFQNGKMNQKHRFIIILNKNADHDTKPGHIIGRIIKRTGNSKILLEIVDSGELKEVEVDVHTSDLFVKVADDSLLNGFIIHGTPQLATTFTALRSPVKRVPWIALPRTQQTQKLREKGFSAAYARGMDEVNEWIALKKSLTKSPAHPYKTHIDYFARQVHRHIEHVAKGIRPENTRALKELERLREHAQEVIEQENVTYYWWLNFNYNLSRIFKKKERRYEIERFVNRFPVDILIPTVLGEIGVSALRKAIFQGVHPIGLVNKKKKADGVTFSPQGFFEHDLAHILSIIELNRYPFNMVNRRFYRVMVEILDDLPLEDRRKVELAYFFLTHENTRAFQFANADPQKVKEWIQDELNKQIKRGFNFQGLIKLSRDPSEKDHQIQEIVNAFVDVFTQIREITTYEQEARPYSQMVLQQ